MIVEDRETASSITLNCNYGGPYKIARGKGTKTSKLHFEKAHGFVRGLSRVTVCHCNGSF